MTPRAIRRAAMRKAEKLARKAARQLTNANPMPNTDDHQLSFADAQPEDSAAAVLATAFDFTDEEDNTPSPSTTQPQPPTSPPRSPSPLPLRANPSNPHQLQHLRPHGRGRSPPVSDARPAANRKNTEHSTGTRTIAGKLKVSLNALKTGLTSQVVVMPPRDATVYQSYLTPPPQKISLPLPTTNKSWRKAS